MKSKEEILELIRNYKFGDDPQSAEELVDIVVDKFYQQTESLRKEVERLNHMLVDAWNCGSRPDITWEDFIKHHNL